MTIPEYLAAKKQEVGSILQANGCSFADGSGIKAFDEFMMFLRSEVDGIYDISMKVMSLFNLSFEKADVVDQRIYTSVINPKYDEFVKYNEELRKLKVENRKYVTPKVETHTPSFNANPRTMVDDQKRGAGFRHPATGTAQFYFSPEDEEEIKNIQRSASSGQGSAKEAMDKVYDRVAEDVMKKAKME